jgi:hypothetical protein
LDEGQLLPPPNQDFIDEINKNIEEVNEDFGDLLGGF